MFDFYKKYLLVKYAADCSIDDGTDHTNKRDAMKRARRYIREGWETVACINTTIPRVEFVTGEWADVYSWFSPKFADILLANKKEA